MRAKANAKINLSLDVWGVRENGYHDLDSIMLPIDLSDLLEIDISNVDSFACNDESLKGDDSNIVYKMINLVKKEWGIEDHFQIRLEKNIPSQAGLGGGSSDGAATLAILEKLYDLHISPKKAKELCLKVGADVYFCFINKPAMVSGIGDHIEEINIKDQYHLLLVKPDSGVSTKMTYERLNIKDCLHPDIGLIRKHLETGQEISGMLGNSLQIVSQQLNPEITQVIKLLKEMGGKDVLMSGSGSCVFAISKDEQEIQQLYNKAVNYPYFVCKTKVIN